MHRLLPLLLSLLVALPVGAQQLTVATGAPDGTYATMFAEFSSVCADSGLVLVQQKTTGSVQNLDLLTANKVNAAFVQADVLFLGAMKRDLGNVKTLVAFHPEEIHLVALAESKVMVGTYGFRKPAVFTDLADLGQYRIGAAGGSYKSLEIIQMKAGVPFRTVEFPTNDAVLAALAAGRVEAALLVGGQPLGPVAKLTRAHKLLTIAGAAAERLKDVYAPARLSYPEMRADGVPSIATDALFVTREYTLPTMVAGLSALRACIHDHLPELQETTGTHQKWQAVKADNHGKWAWYVFPPQRMPTKPRK